MRFKLLGAHREFFQKNGYIELESLLTSEDISALSSHADQLVEKRLSDQIAYKSAEELFRVGRELWREDDLLRKKILSHPLAEIAAELFKKKKIMIGFDQLLRTGSTPGFPNMVPSSLNDISSIFPLSGAILIHLSGAKIPSEIIPSQPENVVFLAPDKTIPWELFFQLPNQSYLLIAYAHPESIYVLQKKDLHTHALKKRGYGFGDRLRHETHPIIYNAN